MRGSYELEPEPRRPDLPGAFVLVDEPEDAIDTIASDLFLHAQNCVRAFGDFHLAMDGCWATERLCQTLMLDPLYRALPWKRTHLWVVAEREDHAPASGLLRDLVVHHSDLPPDQFHPIKPADRSEHARYEARLREHLGWREPGHDRLDFVFLGGGRGGALPLVQAQDRADNGSLVGRFEDGLSDSIAMTSRLVGSARFVTVMALGAEARSQVRAALRPSAEASHDHARLAPVGGTLRWYIDSEALPEHRR